MASYTTNINLKKPTTSEMYNVLDWNDNSDKIDTAIGNLNSQKVAYALGNDTIANIQSAIVTLAGTMADGEIKKIRCNITVATGIFRITAYIGELMRISSSRICVDLRESMDANEAVIGNYKDGTWYWAELVTKEQLAFTPHYQGSSVTIVLPNYSTALCTALVSGVGSSAFAIYRSGNSITFHHIAGHDAVTNSLSATVVSNTSATISTTGTNIQLTTVLSNLA